MENLCNLLFELSNEDRLRILHQLNKEAMNVTNLSRTLSLPTQESSRHVSRLGEVGLTQKGINGFRRLTALGKLVLKQLEGLEFILRHKAYFINHSLVDLPNEFVCRIGDLADSTYIDDVQVAFYSAEKVTQEAEKHIWVITSKYLMNIVPLLREAFERGVTVKKIEPKDWFLPSKLKDGHRVEDAEAKSHARITGLLEERLLDQLDIYLYMSEKEVAGVVFPTLDGRFDYFGFSGTDERSRGLCMDIFQYYWQRARPCESVVDEIYEWLGKRPEAIKVIRNLAKGKEIVINKELISELESAGLIRKGKLTRVGDIVYTRLQRAYHME